MKLSVDKIEEYANSEAIVCPNCKKNVYMKLLRAENSLGVLNIPLLTVNTDVFAICPECSALFTLNKNIAKTAAKNKSNNFTMINDANLTFVRVLK